MAGKSEKRDAARAIAKGTIALLAIFGLFFTGFAGLYAPSVFTDYQVRHQTLVPSTDLKIDNARCTNHMFIVSWCELQYSSTRASNPSVNELRYLLAGSYRDTTVRLLQTNELSPRVVSDFGVAHVLNRAIMLAVVLSMLGIAPFVPLIVAMVLARRSK